MLTNPQRQNHLSTKTSPISFSLPGKAFLVGEYSVLFGGKSVLLSLPPRFELSNVKAKKGNDVAPSSLFPMGCPAQRLLSECPDGFQFKDPVEGAGGIGASSAQFIFAWALLHLEENSSSDEFSQSVQRRWKDVWNAFRKIDSSASGADIACQILGGTLRFEDLPAPSVLPLPAWNDENSTLIVYSTTTKDGSLRKTATHTHLQNQKDSLSIFHPKNSVGMSLQAISQAAEIALTESKPEQLGKAMNAYGDKLAEFGFECVETTEDRKCLMEIPGVYGVKGSGAMQSDLILVLCEKRSVPFVKKTASERNLKLISSRPGQAKGFIACEDSLK